MVLRSRAARAFSLIELMIVVTIIGVLASIAIPALMQSVRRSKTSEATMNLRRIYDGAVTSYQSDGVNRQGTSELPSFPQTVGPSPAADNCCAQVGLKCLPDPAVFRPTSWHKLQFALDDPHYFWYTFESEGDGSFANFTARAEGNLDCDLVFSTFERIGYVDLFGSVTGGGGVFKRHPTE
ncbi:MAG: type II secretion system protein [Myxococcales bacterium]|nr:type II secretion system protein [Myxococcales bacterium]